MAYALFVRQQVSQLEALLQREAERLATIMLEVEVGARLIGDDQRAFIVQLVSQGGQVVLPFGEGNALPLVEKPTMIAHQGREILVTSTLWRLPGGTVHGTIRIGVDVSEARQARRELLRALLISGGIMAVTAVLLGLTWLQRALRPLTLLAQEARAVDPGRPRLAYYRGPQDEVADVAQALNAALEAIRMRQEAERASLAEIAHELAAPLTLVSGHLERLLAQHPEDVGVRAARDAAIELLRSSQDLLTLARGELALPLVWEVVDLGAVVQRIAREYPGIGTEGDTMVLVAGDEQRLTQLVRNLVRNAVQAAGEPGGVTVRLEGDKEVRLAVSDRGPGIASTEVPKLFDRFYTKRQGVGVGLYVARQVALQHGGRIEVQSALGVGSTFMLVLPSLASRLEGGDYAQ